MHPEIRVFFPLGLCVSCGWLSGPEASPAYPAVATRRLGRPRVYGVLPSWQAGAVGVLPKWRNGDRPSWADVAAAAKWLLGAPATTPAKRGPRKTANPASCRYRARPRYRAASFTQSLACCVWRRFPRSRWSARNFVFASGLKSGAAKHRLVSHQPGRPGLGGAGLGWRGYGALEHASRLRPMPRHPRDTFFWSGRCFSASFVGLQCVPLP